MKPANVKRAIGIYLACINLGFLGIAIKLSSGIGIAIGIGAVIWAVVAFRHALFGTGPAESEAPEQPGQPNAGKTSPLAVVLLAMPAVALAALVWVVFIPSADQVEVAAPAPDPTKFSAPANAMKKRGAISKDSQSGPLKDCESRDCN